MFLWSLKTQDGRQSKIYNSEKLRWTPIYTQIFLIFTRNIREIIQFDPSFSNGLVQPPPFSYLGSSRWFRRVRAFTSNQTA